MTMTSHFKNIQALRGVAALLVLAAHISGAERFYGATAILPEQLRIGVAGVDLFFLISGFVMVHVARRTAPGRRSALRFAYNRAARIYPLYWIATIAIMAIYFVRKIFLATATETGALVQSFLLLPQAGLPILVVGWTLVHEIYFYLALSLFLFAAPRRLPHCLALWGAIVALANLAGWTQANAWTAVAFSPLTFEFLAGAGVALLIEKTSAKWGAPALAAGVMIFLVQLFLFDDAGWEAMNDHGARAVIYTAPFALTLYGAASVERAQGWIFPRWLTAAGDASYSIYLFHTPAVIVAGKLVSVTIGDRGVIDNMVMIVACVSASLLSAFLIYRTIERPALAATKRLGDRLIGPHAPLIKPERSW